MKKGLQELEHFQTKRENSFGRSMEADEKLNEEKLQSFDEGYRAGWTDAENAIAKDEVKVLNSISEKLKKADAKIDDFKSKVLLDAAELCYEIIDQVFQTGSEHIVKNLLSDIGSADDTPASKTDIEIQVNSKNKPSISSALSSLDSRFKCVVNDEMSIDTVHISFPNSARCFVLEELKINLKSMFLAQAKRTEERMK